LFAFIFVAIVVPQCRHSLLKVSLYILPSWDFVFAASYSREHYNQTALRKVQLMRGSCVFTPYAAPQGGETREIADPKDNR
jgi:hypothetical protein